MNNIYINKLLEKGRYGRLIYLIETNIHMWSNNDFKKISTICRDLGLIKLRGHAYTKISYYMMHYFRKKDILRHPLDLATMCWYSIGKYESCLSKLDRTSISLCLKKGDLDFIKWLIRNKKLDSLSSLKRYSLIEYITIMDISKLKYIISEYMYNMYPDHDLHELELTSGKLVIDEFINTDFGDKFEYIISEKVTTFLPRLNQKYYISQRNICVHTYTTIRHINIIGYLIKNNIKGCLTFDDYSFNPFYGILLATILNDTQYIYDNIFKLHEQYTLLDTSYIYTILIYAIYNNNLELIKFMDNNDILIIFGRKYYNVPECALQHACTNSYIDIIKYILHESVYFKNDRTSYQHMVTNALKTNNLPVLKCLMSYNDFYTCRINIPKNTNKETLLYLLKNVNKSKIHEDDMYIIRGTPEDKN